jgi:glutamyl/glutaminyl-tRNA synthetase
LSWPSSADTHAHDHEPAGGHCRQLASEINVGERSSGWFPTRLLGYCRTSTADQNPDHQIDALLHNGVDRDNIHVDVTSGAKASRPKLGWRATNTTHRLYLAGSLMSRAVAVMREVEGFAPPAWPEDRSPGRDANQTWGQHSPRS